MADIKEVKLYPQQFDFVQSALKYTAFVGGRGAGKSFSGCVKAIAYAWEHPNCRGAICAPTYKMLRDATMREFFALCPADWVKRFNRQENVVELVNGSVIFFRSLDDPDSTRGLDLHFVFVDEAAKCHPDAIAILKATLRRAGYPQQMWLATTPRGRNWIYHEYVINKTPRHQLFKARSSDNFANPDDFEETLETQYKGSFFQQEVLGEFIGFEGLVYSSFGPEHIGLPTLTDPTEQPYRVVAGVDWGFRDPATVVVLAEYLTGDATYRYTVLDEFYASHQTIDDHCDAMEWLMRQYHIKQFYADPSRPDSIVAARRRNLPIQPADNDILTGIQSVTALIDGRVTYDGVASETPLLMVLPRCEHTLRELTQYQYPDQTLGKNSGEKPIDADNHAMDALRYAVRSVAKQRGGILGFYRNRKKAASAPSSALPPLVSDRTGILPALVA